jgi:hypothetical protein
MLHDLHGRGFRQGHRRTRALAALCAELTAAEATYPGTNLKIVYTIKGHPHAP